MIGATANIASRLEGVCAKRARRVVASADFAHCVDGAVTDFGTTDLKRLDSAQAVFGINEQAEAAIDRRSTG